MALAVSSGILVLGSPARADESIDPESDRKAFQAFFFAKFPLTAFLLPEEAAAALMTLLVAHSLASDLTGLPLDWTQPLVTTVLTFA